MMTISEITIASTGHPTRPSITHAMRETATAPRQQVNQRLVEVREDPPPDRDWSR